MKKRLHSADKFDNALFGRYVCNVAAAVIGSAVVGGAVSASASSKAAKSQAQSAQQASDAQLQAARESNALQKSMYDQNRADSAPWANTGAGALNQLAWKMGITPTNTIGTGTATPYQGNQADFGSLQQNFGMDQFQADPGYQFRMDQGNKSVEQSAAARGMQLSGATMKALQRFGQDTASNEYQNAYNRYNNDQSTQFNRLSGIAGTGQQQVNALGQAGQNYAGSVGSNTMNTANQVANNTIGAGNARAASYISGANGINNAISTGINGWQQQQMLNNMGSNNLTSYGTYPGSQQSNMLAAQW